MLLALGAKVPVKLQSAWYKLLVLRIQDFMRFYFKTCCRVLPEKYICHLQNNSRPLLSIKANFYGYSHFKAKTAVKPPYFYDGNSYFSETTFIL